MACNTVIAIPVIMPSIAIYNVKPLQLLNAVKQQCELLAALLKQQVRLLLFCLQRSNFLPCCSHLLLCHVAWGLFGNHLAQDLQVKCTIMAGNSWQSLATCRQLFPNCILNTINVDSNGAACA